MSARFGKRVCLLMNPGLFWGHMITVYRRPGPFRFLNGLPLPPRGNFPAADNARPHTARGFAQDVLRHFQRLVFPGGVRPSGH
ncbi:hypothetical protein TNCV_4810881 [Trichonephila clavipes]|nr:hypothetical protein TNCV_4810881 [Trichonephila clavipes]